MKGCPLRCKWCHNPEGLSFDIQKNIRTGRAVGRIYSSDALIEKISTFKPFFEMYGGGVTFSGGEATAQGEFLYECCSHLGGIHRVLDTSGFCDEKLFEKILSVVDLVYFDIKLADSKAHEKYTMKPNQLILKNLQTICHTHRKYNVRIPLVPNITDTEQNLNGIRKIILELDFPPESIDLLPYNNLAGGKYEQYGMEYPLENSFTKNNWATVEKFKSELETDGFSVSLH